VTIGRSRFTRRQALAGGAAVAAAAVFGGGYEWRRLRHPSAGDLARLIRRRLGHLQFRDDAVDRFAREYVARYGPQAMAMHTRATAGGLFEIAALRRRLPGDRQQAILTFERRTISTILRSTDYFRVPAGTPVAYVAFPDPYALPCANPFADLRP
jgi:hypothetical protein